LFACPLRDHAYNIITYDAKASQTPLTGPHETTAHLDTSLTLPEYILEVML